jgi:hypothetical protein
MANPEHLALLKQGVPWWNQWRRDHPYIVVDLVGANLARVNLTGINLADAALSNASFFAANLTGADMCRANLTATDFSYAALSGANLAESNLSATMFRFCKVKDTNFGGSLLSSTTFQNVDLENAICLELAKHRGPSSIGVELLFKSGLKLPEDFLRGVGIPEILIQYLHSLIGQPIEFYSCFISHSSKDQNFVERLHSDLQSKAVRCWYAPEDFKIGDKIRMTIDESIRLHDKLLVVLSANSIQSDWVEQEVESALAKERETGRTILFPIRLDDSAMEARAGWTYLVKNTRHIGDFRRWKEHDEYQKSFQRLLRDLKQDDGK